jgi:hypothetical protein
MRRGGGFSNFGGLAPEQLGLPPARGREMLLAHAWRTVAGPALASRATLGGLRRGVLEVRVPAGPWAESVAALLPRLAGRLAASWPSLGVKRYRLVREGAAGPAPAAREVGGVDEERAEAAEPERGLGPRPVLAAPAIGELKRRYLERTAEARRRSGRSGSSPADPR